MGEISEPVNESLDTASHNYAVTGVLLELIDEDTATDINRRALNYAMIMGLGARSCRAAYEHSDADPGWQQTTDPLFGLPAHHFYMNILDRTLHYAKQHLSGHSDTDNPSIAIICNAFYPFSQPGDGEPGFTPRTRLKPDEFVESLEESINIRHRFFDDGHKLTDQERPQLMVYDKAARNASEKTFRNAVTPYSQTGLHLPAMPYPYFYPELIVGFCNPAYWSNQDTTQTNRLRAGFSDRVFAAWAASEHQYWRDQIYTQSYLDVSRQIEELSPAS